MNYDSTRNCVMIFFNWFKIICTTYMITFNIHGPDIQCPFNKADFSVEAVLIATV